MRRPFVVFLFLILAAVCPSQTEKTSAADNTATNTKPAKDGPAGGGLDEIKPVIKKDGKVVLPPEKQSPVNIPKSATPLVIDGKLDDEAWKSAAMFRDFIQTGPGDNIEPSKATIGYMMYDERNLYLGFRCFDEKDKIRASVVKRDSVFGEDNVRVWLDTYNDQRRAYILGFNPLGIQQDGIFTEGQGADFNVDIVMESKGIIEDWGWSVEVKIPFKSLRYVAGKGKSWGFNMARNIDRLNDEFDTWMPDDRNVPGFLIKHGKITGLDEIKAERTFEIIPTATFKETGKRVSPTKFSNPPIKPDFGFTLKYSITPNVTLDAAYNPDFADTEADAPVVEANQRFPIFFSEKRPFFLEGIDIFQTQIQAVHTRQIINPDVAVKLSGKIGKNSFGILGAVDDPSFGGIDRKAFAGIFRYKRDVGKENHIGFLATNYSFGPRQHNMVAGFDGKWKINKNTELSGQVLGSRSNNCFFDPAFDPAINPTQEQSNIDNCGSSYNKYRAGNAIKYTMGFSVDKKNFSWGLGANGTSKDFRADLGFTNRTDTNQYYVYANFQGDPKPKAFIINRFINTSFGFRHDWQGRVQSYGWDLNFNASLKGNAFVGAGGYLNKENIYEDEFGLKRNPTRDGAFFGSFNRTAFQKGFFTFFSHNLNKRVSYSVSGGYDFDVFDFDFGAGRRFPRVSPAALAFGQFAPQDPGPGRQLFLNGGIGFKPTNKFSFSLNANKSKLTRTDTGLVAFDSNIFSLRSTYQFTQFISIRARLDYNTLSSRVFGQYTFGWTPSPGKALYVGYNDNWIYNGFFSGVRQPGMMQLNRTFYIKFSYLFRKSF